jgi:hypothetical protein
MHNWNVTFFYHGATALVLSPPERQEWNPLSRFSGIYATDHFSFPAWAVLFHARSNDNPRFPDPVIKRYISFRWRHKDFYVLFLCLTQSKVIELE